MSIAGVIEHVVKTEEGLELELTGKLYQQPEGGTIENNSAGVKALTILNPTWTPEMGMEIWGGSGDVCIEAGYRRWYHRVGYTRLRENFG